MYNFIVSLIVFVVGLQEALSASIQHPLIEEDNVKNNLVGYESESIEGLIPPTVKAQNYYSVQSDKSDPFENPYVVEISKNYISIKTTGIPPQKIKLNQTESEGIQKLSLAFVELLNSSKLSSQQSENETETPQWENLSPLIALSNSGVFLQFLTTSKAEPNATEISPENRKILWDFLSKYTRNIFEEKLKQLKITEKYAEVLDTLTDSPSSSAFENFVNFLWNIMKLSVNYAETAFEGWTTSQPEVTSPESERKLRSTTVTLFAYEEPSPFHEFPSQEFLHRRKDLDTIFYGRGVI